MASIQSRTRNRNRPYAVQWRGPAGRHREHAFATKIEARSFLVKLQHDIQTGTYADPAGGQVGFASYAQQVIDRADLSGGREAYAGILRAWIGPCANGRTLAQVASDREGACWLINERMARNGKLLSNNRRSTARTVLTMTVAEAVKAGRLQSHRLGGLKLVRGDAEVSTTDRRDFVFPRMSRCGRWPMA